MATLDGWDVLKYIETPKKERNALDYGRCNDMNRGLTVRLFVQRRTLFILTIISYRLSDIGTYLWCIPYVKYSASPDLDSICAQRDDVPCIPTTAHAGFVCFAVTFTYSSTRTVKAVLSEQNQTENSVPTALIPSYQLPND